ncbi:hypothetical protein [Pedobacter sp. ASV12]|uniref:hypothetical protein n=1 Tax=Pedobacter sp. ASV12 TaxID=2795120 RepID=UPI0018EB649D|nr:hypothetical protein [Pedobacter sp. ASV12]
MTTPQSPKRPVSWLTIIAVLIALAGVGFVLFLKTSMPADRFKKEPTPKTKVN